MDQKSMDPFERASNPTTFGNEFWGKLQIDAWICALVKGQGKVPFNPQVHDKPATALDLSIIALPEMGITNDKILERKMIAESGEWSKFGWASLKALGIANLREAVDRWVKAEVVPTGETYQKDGMTKEKTTFKFVTLFADEAACRADYIAVNGAPAPAPATPTQTPAPAPAPAAATNEEKQTATVFMKQIVTLTVKKCVGKPLDEAINEVATVLAQYPGVCKYYSAQSPEVVELIMSLAGAPAA